VADLVEREELRVLVLYQPPWEAFVEACSVHRFADGVEAVAWLREWREFHERVLRDRELAPDRVFLVNAARLAPQLAELRAALGLQDAAQELSAELGATAALVGEHFQLLCRRIEELAPDYWQTYEELESVALLFGREAEFRGTGHPDRALELQHSLAMWGDAVAARVRDRQASEAAGSARSNEELVARLQLEHTADAERNNDLQLENELLAHMIQQMQEELAYHVRSNEELRQALEQSTDAGERARVLVSRMLSAQDR